MRLKVNPNRMEVLRLRKRLTLATRGHRLLKDKLDELMRRFTERLEEIRALRERVEEMLARVNERMVLARGLTGPHSMETVGRFPGQKTEIEFSSTRLLNLRLPHIETRCEGSTHSYGFRSTCADLDEALRLASEAFPHILHLAELERGLELMAAEIEATRRRVNALEYILMPSLRETIRWITMKLAEAERETVTRLMKVKGMAS